MSINFAQYALLIVVVGMGTILTAVTAISTIWKNIVLAKAAKNPVRIPPLSEEVVRLYATKAELKTANTEQQACCRTNLDRIDKIHSELFALVRSTQKDIGAKIETLSDNMSEWQRGIERQIGKLEGKISNEHQNNHPSVPGRPLSGGV